MRKKTIRLKWTTEALHIEALKYPTRNDFKKNSPAYQTARRRGILEEICSHMEPSKTGTYSIEEIASEAKKYNTRKEFEIGSRWAYIAAWKRDLLDTICSHMSPMLTYWTDEMLQNEANKHKNRSKAYYAAHLRGILDQICAHMGVSGSSSIPEMELLFLIKSIYPMAKKIRDSSVSIPNKPYIRGFDIDIYVPELNKGIEFDGKYWHSPQGLRKGRPNWSDEDLRNYHEIKDSWFSSKGIQILHIGQNDWESNKNESISKIENFLGVQFSIYQEPLCTV